MRSIVVCFTILCAACNAERGGKPAGDIGIDKQGRLLVPLMNADAAIVVPQGG